MSDKAKKPQPDRAGSEPLDDIDVPTYTGGQATPKPGSTPAGAGANDPTRVTENLYNRTGRAAPQAIPPKQAPARGSAAKGPTATAGTTAAGAGTTGAAAKPAPDESDPTTAFAVPDHRPMNSEPLRSDAPTTSLDRREEQPEQAPATQVAESSYADTDFAPAGATSFAQGPPVDQPPAQPPAQPAGYPDQTVVAGGAAGGAVGATAVSADSDSAVAPARDHRRGTIDGGILLIRLLLGVVLILTSIATFFQLGGATGLTGLEAEFAGYQVPDILAIAVPSMQLAAGVFLVFGLITPVFAAVATVVTSFTALHALTDSGAGLNVFAWDAAVMLSVILLGISVALQFTGPGLYSFDYGRRWARRPLASSWIFVILGIAGAVALWWFGAGVNPLS